MGKRVDEKSRAASRKALDEAFGEVAVKPILDLDVIELQSRFVPECIAEREPARSDGANGQPLSPQGAQPDETGANLEGLVNQVRHAFPGQEAHPPTSFGTKVALRDDQECWSQTHHLHGAPS